MYSLEFKPRVDGEESELDIYLEARNKPIGEIVRCREGWTGRLALNGCHREKSSKKRQDIVDHFEAWVAADMPADSSLLRPPKKRRSQRVSVMELLG